MVVENFDLFPNLRQVDASEMKRLGSTINQQDHVTGTADVSLRQTVAGLSIRNARAKGFWIQIVAHGNGNAYAWKSMIDDSTGNLVVNADGMSGTSTVLPVWEINQNANVPNGTNVWAWPAMDRESGFYFEWHTENEVVVYILENIIEGGLDSCSFSASASSSVFTGDLCRPTFYHAVVQVFDEDCEVWNNTECVYAVEVSGRRLAANTRYLAKFLGTKTKYTEALAVAVGDPCADAHPTKVYGVQSTGLSVVIQVDQIVGKVCLDSGSGSSVIGGHDSSGNPVFGQCNASTNLQIYLGFIMTWDRVTCSYTTRESEPVYIAETEGRQLIPGKEFLAHYMDLLPLHFLEASASDSTDIHPCRPLYLTECAGFSGTLYVYGPPTGGGIQSGSGSNSGKPEVAKLSVFENRYECGHLTCSVEHVELTGDLQQICTQVSLCPPPTSGSPSESPSTP